MSILELAPSRVNPGSHPGEILSSRGELLSPSRVTPGALAQSCHILNSCASHDTPESPVQSCHFMSTSPGMTLLAILSSNVTPCTLTH